MLSQNIPPFSRRQFLRNSACGFGSIALTALLGEHLSAAPAPRAASLAPVAPHFSPRARRVIFLFMQGGPSQIDLFDEKPRLVKEHGKPIPFQRPKDEAEDGIERSLLLAPVAKVRPRGQSGLVWSDLLPNLGSHIDKICLLKAMVADNPAHPPAVMQIQTGFTTGPQPAVGSWISYGLGTENRDLPGFITIAPLMAGDGGGPHLFGSAYLPAMHQGTAVLPGKDGIPRINYLQRPGSAPNQKQQLAFLETLNREHLARAEVDSQLEGMIKSFELAFRMQTAVPELFDISRESAATQRLYGIGEKSTDSFGRRCLLARRLAESGVRFVQITQDGWDHHQNIRRELPRICGVVDRPIAGLLQDLQLRGMLDETLVIWGGEFGRSPYDQDVSGGKDGYETFGRGHNPYGFTMWLAGGGIRGGLAYGQTDDYGYRAIAENVHIHDLHATMLHLLGLDHEKLTYRHAGRDFRLTDVYGRVVREILA